jgi:integrase
MAKKGRKVKGALKQRGGMWVADWTAHGVRNRRSTEIPVKGRDAAETAENRKRAQKLLEDWVSPYKAEAEADVRAALAARQKDAQEVAEEKMAVVVAEANRIPLADAWMRFPYDTSQPTRGRTAVHPLSSRNVRENETAWNKFLTWVKAEKGPGLAMQDVTPGMALDYSKHLQAQGYTPSRHNLLLLVCRVMYRLAGVQDPFAKVPKLKKQKAQSRDPFEKEQVARMLAAAHGEWRGFLAVLYYTGLRAGDAVLLTHANRVHGEIRVTTAKTEADVVLYEHPQLTRILEDVIDRRPPGKNTPLFPKLAELYRDKGGHALSRQFETFMRRTLGSYQVEEDGSETFIPFEGMEDRKHGVRKISRYGLHSFRHALATAAAQGGVPLASVQRWLGHASQAVTQIYADHGSAEEKAKMVAALSLDEATPAPLALPAAPGAEDAPPSLPCPHDARNALAAILDALRGMVGELEEMTGENWAEKRDRALAIAAAANGGVK